MAVDFKGACFNETPEIDSIGINANCDYVITNTHARCGC